MREPVSTIYQKRKQNTVGVHKGTIKMVKYLELILNLNKLQKELRLFSQRKTDVSNIKARYYIN